MVSVGEEDGWMVEEARLETLVSRTSLGGVSSLVSRAEEGQTATEQQGETNHIKREKKT